MDILGGIKVVDFTWVVVGPMLGRYLADYGASVVHVETSTRPDTLRMTPPYRDDKPGIDRSGCYANYNCNKYGVSLNLNHPEGLRVAKKLVKWADIFLESFMPGTMAKWGMDYQSLREINPSIIMLSTSSQGQTGPHSVHPSYGTILVSLAGVTNLTGWPDRGPAQPYGAYTDVIAPRFGAAALVAALKEREKTGQGCYLDLSQLEAALQFISPALLDFAANGREASRQGNACSYASPHAAYRCLGEDRWCVIAVFNDRHWEGLCRVLKRHGLAWQKQARFSDIIKRKNNEAELDRLLGQWTEQQKAEDVVSWLQSEGVPSGLVENARDIHEDPQLQYQDYFMHFDHPEIGKHCCDGPSFKLSLTPAGARFPAPLLGQHNEYVYKELLGISEEEYVSLLISGAFE